MALADFCVIAIDFSSFLDRRNTYQIDPTDLHISHFHTMPYKMYPPLVMWRDLSPYGAPMRSPDRSSPRVLVIGGGVTGLITSWVLLDRGYNVTIISKEWASYYPDRQRLTSQIAGALWEFPPAVCGQHTDATSLSHSKRWCMVAYHIWDAIAAIPELSAASGVRTKPA